MPGIAKGFVWKKSNAKIQMGGITEEVIELGGNRKNVKMDDVCDTSIVKQQPKVRKDNRPRCQIIDRF